jgi:hypothetical protein
VEENWEVRQSDFGISSIVRHGLYAGEGSITTKGPYFSNEEGPGKGYYDFGYRPNDMGDAVAKAHDVEEDFGGFKGWRHTQNILADIKLVRRLEKYLELAKDENYIDPFTKRRPSRESIQFANDAITLFSIEITRKKIQLTLQAVDKQISMSFLNYMQGLIKQAETAPVILPEPNKTDK